MTTFDSSQYDIPTLIAKLRDQRFDGYDTESLAKEVEKFRDGGGTASMGDAVDALKQIAGALSHTDTTLRDQLKALGVTWESKAGGQASAVLAEQAGFSSDANTKVAQAAQLIFEQGEAFNRTKNKLPDPEALRQSDGTYTAADSLFSLFGFETDHAKAVRGSIEAQAQAVDALNSYAHDTGDYLSSSEPVAEPQAMETFASPGAAAQSVATPQIQPVPPVSSVPDTSPTIAAGAKDAPVAHSTPVVHQAAPAPASSASASTPPIGIPAAPSGSASATTPQATAPSSTSTSTNPVTAPISGSSGKQRPGGTSETLRPGGTGGTSPGVPGNTSLTPGGSVTGSTPGGVPGGDKSAAAWGKPGAAEGKPGGGAARMPNAGESSALGKGKVFGSSPISSSSANVGPGLANVRAAGGVSGLAEGAPAIGAAGAAGATSGERERPGRGFGKSDNAGKRVRQLPVGDLPEEEEAQLAKKAAPEPPSRERTRSILEPAATQDGEEDAEHIRRYGVDDRDLFTDQRGVSPDVIGERAVPEDRP